MIKDTRIFSLQYFIYPENDFQHCQAMQTSNGKIKPFNNFSFNSSEINDK